MVGFNPVAIRINNKRRVVTLAVVGTQTWRAIVAPSRGERRLMKRRHAFSRRRVQAEVQSGLLVRRHWALRRVDPELRGFIAVAQRAARLTQTLVAQWFQGDIIKAPRGVDIFHANGNVVDHRFLLAKNSASSTQVSGPVSRSTSHPYNARPAARSAAGWSV